MLNWYRYFIRDSFPYFDHLPRLLKERNSDGRVRVPTLLLWGERDVYIDVRTGRHTSSHFKKWALLKSARLCVFPLANYSMSFCDNGRLVLYPDASHWLPKVPNKCVLFFSVLTFLQDKPKETVKEMEQFLASLA
jgi:pimeloyl-ACP methyl ester carboxylesterase